MTKMTVTFDRRQAEAVKAGLRLLGEKPTGENGALSRPEIDALIEKMAGGDGEILIGVIVEGGVVQEVCSPKPFAGAVVVMDFDDDGDVSIPLVDAGGRLSGASARASVAVYGGERATGSLEQLRKVRRRVERQATDRTAVEAA